MKKLLCLCLTLLLVLPGAQAGEVIRGEGTLRGTPFTLHAETADTAFTAVLDGACTLSLAGAREADGRLLLANGSGTGVLLPSFDAGEALRGVRAALADSVLYETARYSSLFTQMQTVELSSPTVAGLLSPLLAVWPMSDAKEAQLAALQEALTLPPQPWAVVSHYQADPRQYPDTALWQLNLYAPGLPAVFGEVRTDEYGQSFTLAAEASPVADWDEAVLALEEGKSPTGLLLKGFTLVFRDSLEVNTYAELALQHGSAHYLLEIDHYASVDKPGDWEAEVTVKDGTGAVLLTADLTSQETPDVRPARPACTTLLDAAAQPDWLNALLK